MISLYHYPKAGKLLTIFVIGILLALSAGSFLINTSVSPQDIHTETIPTPTTLQTSTVPYRLELVADNLSVPWSLVFTSASRILVTERPGMIREIINGTVNPDPLIKFDEVNSIQEEGLMGLEKDPEYEKNKYLYVAISYPKGGGYVDKIVRLVDKQHDIVVDKILLDNIPAAQVHAGSRLKFGPDGKLYITTGDATQKEKAQDIQFLGGKILRMNTDGTIPPDNPISGSYVYSYGHRNPQGITWNPVSKEMYETEHGPSGFDGPGGGDEINHIVEGKNYGWPIVHHDQSKEGMISPLITFTPAVAPASALIYSGKIFPQFTHNLFFGGLRGTGLYRVIFIPSNPDKIERYEKMPDINVGRIRDVIEGPNGYIYFTTSNTDGRGTPNSADDKIYRLIPQ